jgi:hypothetical protein
MQHDNPEFLVSILAKLSRKMSEASIYTKLKVLLSLHILSNNLPDKTKYVVIKCIQSLRSTIDEKVGAEFFSLDTIESSAASVSTVGEVEAVELTSAYGQYYFSFMDDVVKVLDVSMSQKLSSKKTKGADYVLYHSSLVEGLLSVLDKNFEIQDIASKSSSALGKICLEQIKADRMWLTKQLGKIYEVRVHALVLVFANTDSIPSRLAYRMVF